MPIVVKAVHKTLTSPPERGKGRRWKFVLTTGKLDRDGDRILASGVDLTEFKRNPVALRDHDHTRPIGRWEDLAVIGSGWDAKLVGWLQLPPEGVSEDADEAHGLMLAKVLGACSIGFRPDPDHATRTKTGYDFAKVELYECSVVAVGSQPDALLAARLGGKAPQPVLWIAPSAPQPPADAVWLDLGDGQKRWAHLATFKAALADVPRIVHEEIGRQIRLARGRLD
jgi:HK97 family phage prohead protease